MRKFKIWFSLFYLVFSCFRVYATNGDYKLNWETVFGLNKCKQIGNSNLFHKTFNFNYKNHALTSKIKGVIKDLDSEPIKVIFKFGHLNKQLFKTDTCKIINNEFFYQIDFIEPCFVTFEIQYLKQRDLKGNFWLFNNDYTIEIEDGRLNLTSLEKPSNEELKFKIITDSIKFEVNKIEKYLRDFDYTGSNIENIQESIKSIRDSSELAINTNIYLRAYRNNLNNIVGLWALINYAERPLDNPKKNTQTLEIKKLFNNLSVEIRQLPSGKYFNNQLNIEQSIIPGSYFKDLSLLNYHSNKVNLSSLLGKLTLIEFWASWCIPCRENNPQLKEIYKTYKKNGFKIITITLDERVNTEIWKQVIKQDGIEDFDNFSDFDKVARVSYDIRIIPSNILLDSSGKILFKNIEIEKLKQLIDESFISIK